MPESDSTPQEILCYIIAHMSRIYDLINPFLPGAILKRSKTGTASSTF